MNHRSLACARPRILAALVLCGLVLGFVDSSVARAEG